MLMVVHHLTVVASPTPAYIQSGRSWQRLNCDFLLHTTLSDRLLLDKIELGVYDKSNQLLLRRRLDAQATSPSIATLPQRNVSMEVPLYLFNPFSLFDSRLSLYRLHYQFYADDEHGHTIQAAIDVYPQQYRQQVALSLPLRGRIWVDDGNDDYAHHRRVDLQHPLIRQLGITTNDGRYAWDLMPIDIQGNVYAGSGTTNQDFYGFGVPVYAPGDGIVVEARNDVVDNLPYQGTVDLEAYQKDSTVIFGNYVRIDHGTGEYSLLFHLQQGSLMVTPGSHVQCGSVIAALGNSGWSFYPHVHYQLNGQRHDGASEGLPARFDKFQLLLNAEAVTLRESYPETGEMLFIEG